MILVAPIGNKHEILAWLQDLRDKGLDKLAEAETGVAPVAKIRLIDPLKRNVFREPLKQPEDEA